MSHTFDEVNLSQKIFYYLLEHRELSEEKERDLYKEYIENEQVMKLVKNQGEIARSMIVRYGNVIYLIPNEDNALLGFSKKQLKTILCKSGATDKDYYLSQFVILTLLVEFYDGHGGSSKTRDFIRVGELLNIIEDRLREGAQQEENAVEGLAFSNMLEAFGALRSENLSKKKTTKEGFLHTILTFMQNQGLLEYIEVDEMIQTTVKLDRFMDWNLLNANHYKRVLKVLGVDGDE